MMTFTQYLYLRLFRVTKVNFGRQFGLRPSHNNIIGARLAELVVLVAWSS